MARPSSPELLGVATARCSLPMIQNTGKGGLYRYYCCSSKLKKGPSACRGLRTPMEKLDKIVVGEVARQVLDPDRLAAMLDAYVQSAAVQADGAKTQLAKLRHDHTAAAAGIARLLELVEKGLMEAEDPAMRERLVALKLQRDQIAREIGELQNRMASSAPTITPERVARVGGLRGKSSTRALRSFDRPTPGCSWMKSALPMTKFASAARNPFSRVAPRKASSNLCRKFSLLFEGGARDMIRTCGLCLRREANALAVWYWHGVRLEILGLRPSCRVSRASAASAAAPLGCH